MTPECSTITAIEPQARRRERVSVFIDGAFAFGVHAEVAAAAGLSVGQVVSTEELQGVLRAEELRRAKESALHFLGYRARSRVELQRRLLQKGYEPDLVDEALSALSRSGLINDAEFTQSWVHARTGARPMGPNRLAAELRQKGVDRELIDQALQAIDPDRELDLALAVGRRKAEQMHEGDPRTARRKLAAALMRRGFSGEICTRVLDIVLRDDR